MSKISRSLTRRFAVEVLYQCALGAASSEDVLNRYLLKKRVDQEYLTSLVNGIASHQIAITSAIEDALVERAYSELDLVEQAILQMSVYELMHRYDVPYRVVINESVNLAKTFGGQDAHKLVNSVLDRVAKDVRRLECGGDSK